MATSEPRSSDRRPSSASDERNVRSALRREAKMESYPGATREDICANSHKAVKNRGTTRIPRSFYVLLMLSIAETPIKWTTARSPVIGPPNHPGPARNLPENHTRESPLDFPAPSIYAN